jgi:nitrile hydratase accessory protein
VIQAVNEERLVADMTGSAALPRQNGELVFSAPWESRAFGIAVALLGEGLYEWDEFRKGLIDQLAADENDDRAKYYECWLTALEQLLIDRGFVTAPEIKLRMAELAASPDHRH